MTQSQAKSQGAGPCNIREISIRHPAEPRSQTSPRRCQKLYHSFPWNSHGVRVQGHPECENLSGISTYAWGCRGASPAAWKQNGGNPALPGAARAPPPLRSVPAPWKNVCDRGLQAGVTLGQFTPPNIQLFKNCPGICFHAARLQGNQGSLLFFLRVKIPCARFAAEF